MPRATSHTAKIRQAREPKQAEIRNQCLSSRQSFCWFLQANQALHGRQARVDTTGLTDRLKAAYGGRRRDATSGERRCECATRKTANPSRDRASTSKKTESVRPFH